MSQVAVGATLPQFSDDRDRLLASARAAEDAGLDSLWLFDHLWPLSGGKQRPVMECFTTLAWLAAVTERIKVGTLVARSSLRYPSLLAKMAATVATIAPGRAIVTIGSGDEASRAENEAFGLDYFEADERVGQLETTVQVVHDYLHAGTVTAGEPARVRDLPSSPRPEPRPSLWVGGRSDDVLALAGRYADGWNAWGGTPERFALDARQLLAYAGSRPIELSWGGIVTLASEEEPAAAAAPRPGTPLAGGPGEVVERLEGFVAAGARHLVLTPAGSSAGPDFYRTLGSVRERLAV